MLAHKRFISEEREAVDPGMGHVEWRRWESLKIGVMLGQEL